MCVAVTLAPGTDLTLLEVERMNRSNADGVGVAWARDGIVQWYKTTKVDPNYITQMIRAWTDHPRLVHFRFATAGGTRPDLCHPFEIGPQATCAPVGTAARVMIHNGHWGRWSDVKDLLSKEGLLPDNGPWSDTRLAAYLAHMDPDWLAALGGRVAVMSGDGAIHRLGDWQELRPGIMVSNKSWDTSNSYTRGGYTGYRNWKGWTWSEEETKAFFEEEAKRAEEELEASIKNAEAKEKESETRSQKKARKREERNARKSGQGDSPNHDGAPRSRRATEPLPVQNGASGAKDTTALSRTVDARPWYNATQGRWYTAVKRNGVTTVVEVAPPGTEGSAST